MKFRIVSETNGIRITPRGGGPYAAGMPSTLLSDRPGFTPMIARLIGMMTYTRETTLEAVQGWTPEELDLIPDGHANSAGMLLAHMAAVERIYQLISDGHPDPDGALEAHHWPGLNLGQQGRNEIRGRPLRHYLEALAQVRAGTLALLAARDDAWLDEPLPLWGDTGNRHFMWFHVFDLASHRPQENTPTPAQARVGAFSAQVVRACQPPGKTRRSSVSSSRCRCTRRCATS